jgi:multidrug efflux pump subunit AcrA (membrane-fusion protein)
MSTATPESSAQIDALAGVALSGTASNRTALEVDRCLEELAQLAQSDLSPQDFYVCVLDRALRLLPSVGGAVWQMRPAGEAELISRSSFPPPLLDRPRRAAEVNGQPAEPQTRSIPAFARGSALDPSGHPHPWPLVVCSLPAELHTSVMLEIALTPDTGPDVQAGGAQLVGVMAEIAADFHRRRELSRLRQRDTELNRFADLVSRLHANLDPTAVAYAIANEGRTWIGCDRVSVLKLRHGKAVTLAVSAVDRVERASGQVAALEGLASAVAAGGERLTWNEGFTEELSPELAGALQSYLDRGHARQLVAFPLRQDAADSKSSLRDTQSQSHSLPTGMLVAESFAAGLPLEHLVQRSGELAQLSASALGNALAHHHLPLLPLQMRAAALLATISRRPVAALLAVLCVATAVALLATVPADFTVEVTGQLQPQKRQNLFAPSDGVVAEVFVEHAQRIAKGDLLLRLRNPSLDLDEGRLEGELQTALARLNAVRAARSRPDDSSSLDGNQQRRSDQERLASEEVQLREQIQGLENQLAILRHLRQELDLSSPLDGVVLTWNTHQLLDNRPVKQGQLLLAVADAAGPWALELKVPDRASGHVLDGQRLGETNLPVTYLLASDPAVTHRGHLDRLALATDAAGGKSAADAIVALDGPLPGEARAGSQVTARIHCGRRSIGYVWLHDLIDFVRTSLF